MKQALKYVLTANDLLEGDVVYLDAQNHWSQDLSSAMVFEEKQYAEDALSSNAQNNQIVGPYITEITIKDKKLTPYHFREEFRATGPSNYFHGKQKANHV